MKFKWRFKASRFEEYFCWTYKRNYKAVLTDTDGERYSFEVYEVSDPNDHNLIYRIESADQIVTKERAEQILFGLARFGKLEPLDSEKNAYEYRFYPENINYMEKTPYELSQEAL